MKKALVFTMALTASVAVEAAYRDNAGVQWPTLFGVDKKAQCDHAGAKKTQKVATFGAVHFAYKSASVSGSEDDLTLVGELMEAHPKKRFIVVGHTDSKGSDVYNQDLSEQRAQAVMAWLVANGVDADRLSAEGRGEGEPVADNATAEGRAQNRRVELHMAR